ncbi:unnamed protein product [Cylicocyclus nassatus]|uniref:Uncharacterized protein n=1 Tax=Cylicocyclus nassatus TaxID=53992 RepID=A0AA36M203_CYLNA|nr:unnamed protein product [Cylicocyclus nassatus]
MKIILLLVALFCMAMATSVDVCVSKGRAGCMAFCKHGAAGSTKKIMKGFCVRRRKCENSGRKRRCRRSPVCYCRFPPYKIDK